MLANVLSGFLAGAILIVLIGGLVAAMNRAVNWWEARRAHRAIVREMMARPDDWFDRHDLDELTAEEYSAISRALVQLRKSGDVAVRRGNIRTEYRWRRQATRVCLLLAVLSLSACGIVSGSAWRVPSRPCERTYTNDSSHVCSRSATERRDSIQARRDTL